MLIVLIIHRYGLRKAQQGRQLMAFRGSHHVQCGACRCTDQWKWNWMVHGKPVELRYSG